MTEAAVVRRKGDKKTLLFFISEETYVRHYWKTGVLEFLSREFELRVIVGDKIRGDSEICASGFKLLRVSHSPKREAIHDTLNQVLMWRNRHLSRTFLYRWMRMANWDLVPTQGGPIAKLVGFARWLMALFGNHKALSVVFLGSRALFPITEKVLSRYLKTRPGLSSLILTPRPDLVVFPSSAHESLVTDLILECEEHGIPTLALIDNWDNLASKTVFWKQPSYIAVWGPQTAGHAVNIQGFHKSRVFSIGTPRFENYFTRVEPDESLQPKEPYILFVGSAMPFDELTALHDVENALNQLGSDFDNLRVIYRPHPWQQKRKVFSKFLESDFKRTTLDAQMAEAYHSNFGQSDFQPSLDYYPQVLRHASVVVGPLTTMLFEAALCRRNVIALAYPDGIHFNTSRRYFSHFDGMERVHGFQFCEEKSRLASLIYKSVKNSVGRAEHHDSSVDYFLTTKPGTYSERLKSLIQELTSH